MNNEGINNSLLITAQEIAQITGNTTWNEKVATNGDWYYFDSKTTTESDTCKKGGTNGCKYGWLYDRTSTICTEFGCLNNSDKETYGYWTASSFAGRSSAAWNVYYDARVADIDVTTWDGIGVRPVITVLKSNLS